MKSQGTRSSPAPAASRSSGTPAHQRAAGIKYGRHQKEPDHVRYDKDIVKRDDLVNRDFHQCVMTEADILKCPEAQHIEHAIDDHRKNDGSFMSESFCPSGKADLPDPRCPLIDFIQG